MKLTRRGLMGALAALVGIKLVPKGEVETLKPVDRDRLYHGEWGGVRCGKTQAIAAFMGKTVEEVREHRVWVLEGKDWRPHLYSNPPSLKPFEVDWVVERPEKDHKTTT